MTSPKAAVFDIGNVLLEWDPDRLYGQIFPDPADRQAFYDRTKIYDTNEAIDRGAPFKPSLYALADAHPSDADAIRAWHDRWAEMAYALIDEAWVALRALRQKGVPVFALSNFGDESFDLAEQLYPDLKEFDQQFISGRLKTIKPEPKIYEVLERDTGMSGADLIFFDDRSDNIEAAEARGWTGVIVHGPQDVRDALLAAGLLATSDFET